MTNERLAKQLDYIHTTGFGVEIEMNSITRERAAGTAADFFGTERYENTARKNGYSTWSAWDAQGREWKFQKDVSITGPDSQKCELVTPILHYEDLENLQESPMQPGCVESTSMCRRPARPRRPSGRLST